MGGKKKKDYKQLDDIEITDMVSPDQQTSPADKSINDKNRNKLQAAMNAGLR